ncbi:MAG: H-type lectin domain-containing protein [Flavobacteriales bacterium]|nr:H-type lectin domain-containing protein [Flavobacteriales bacterium]
MKIHIISFAAVLLITAQSIAQAPDKMSYQAVVRDASNDLVISSSVGMQISILQSSATGTAVYVETHATTSNVNGLVSIEIGDGAVVSGTFSSIDWTAGPYFIQTDMDPTGGTSYTITGTSQLISVPYAFYSSTSGSSTPGPQGPPGNNGASAYEIWLNQGNTGTQADFLASLEGVQGPQGPAGPPGTNFFSNMQGGKIDIGNVPSTDVLKVVSVTFPTPFTNPPSVICTASEEPGTIYDDSFNLTTRNITTTGFEIVVNRVDGTWWGQDIDAHWLAFE